MSAAVSSNTRYAIVCVCGTDLLGARLPTSQLIPCTSCRKPVFIFPASPLPALDASPPSIRIVKVSQPRKRLWVAPAIAAGIAIAAVAASTFALIQTHRSMQSPDQPRTAAEARAKFDSHRSAAIRHMTEASYHLARNEFVPALELADRAGIPIAEVKLLKYQAKQASALADLVSEPIEEIVRRASGMANAEWEIVFAERYAGRTIVFDCPVQRTATGKVEIDYPVAKSKSIRLDADGVKLFHQINPLTPQRMFFALRLQSVTRNDGGWTVRFLPDSGTLFTEAAWLTGSPFGVDNELNQIIIRQRERLADVAD